MCDSHQPANGADSGRYDTIEGVTPPRIPSGPELQEQIVDKARDLLETMDREEPRTRTDSGLYPMSHDQDRVIGDLRRLIDQMDRLAAL